MKQIRKRVFAALLSAAIASSWCVPVGAASCKHKHVDAEVISEATCTENGELAAEGTCLDCGETVKVKKTTVKKLGHDYKEAVWDWDESGHWQECARCGEPKKVIAHKYAKGTVCEDEAECTDKNCEYVKPAGEHVWGKAKVTKKVTCIADGEETYTCTVKGCGAKDIKIIEAHGEPEENPDKPAVEATCTTAGKTAELICSECGKVAQKQTTIKKLGHKMDELCSDETGHWYACEREGCEYTDKVKAHDFGKALCDDAAECKVCGWEKTPGEHTWGKAKVTKKVTCTENGEETYTCTVKGCGAKDIKIIEAHGIAEENPDKPTVEATCTTAGKTAELICSECGKVVQKQTTIKKLGHKLDELCSDETGHWYACEREGCEYTDKVKAHDFGKALCDDAAECKVCEWEKTPGQHTWGKAKVTKKVTCTENGEETYTCTVKGCGAKDIKIIEAHGIAEENPDKPAVEATCTTAGKTAELICSECGKVVQKQTTIKKLGHEPSEWLMDEDSHWQVCTRCDEILSDVGHKFKNGVCKTCGCVEQSDDIGELGVAQNPEFISWGDNVAIFFEDPDDTTGIASYIVEMYKGGKWHSATWIEIDQEERTTPIDVDFMEPGTYTKLRITSWPKDDDEDKAAVAEFDCKFVLTKGELTGLTSTSLWKNDQWLVKINGMTPGVDYSVTTLGKTEHHRTWSGVEPYGDGSGVGDLTWIYEDIYDEGYGTKSYAIIAYTDSYAEDLNAGITMNQTEWFPLCTPGVETEEPDDDYTVSNVRFEEERGMPVLMWDAPEGLALENVEYRIWLGDQDCGTNGDGWNTTFTGLAHLEPGTYRGATIETLYNGGSMDTLVVSDIKLTITGGKTSTATPYFELRDDGRYHFFVEDNMGGDGFSVCIYEDERMQGYVVDSMEIMGDNRHGTGMPDVASQWIANGNAIYMYREYSNISIKYDGTNCSFTARDQEWRKCNVVGGEDEEPDMTGSVDFTMIDGTLCMSWDAEKPSKFNDYNRYKVYLRDSYNGDWHVLDIMNYDEEYVQIIGNERFDPISYDQVRVSLLDWDSGAETEWFTADIELTVDNHQTNANVEFVKVGGREYTVKVSGLVGDMYELIVANADDMGEYNNDVFQVSGSKHEFTRPYEFVDNNGVYIIREYVIKVAEGNRAHVHMWEPDSWMPAESTNGSGAGDEESTVPAVTSVWFEKRGDNGLNIYWTPGQGAGNLHYRVEMSPDGGKTWAELVNTSQTDYLVDHAIDMPAGHYNKIRVIASDRSGDLASSTYVTDCAVTITDIAKEAPIMTAMATGAFRDYGNGDVQYEYIVSIAGLESRIQYILGHREENSGRRGTSSFYADNDGNATEDENLGSLAENEFLVWMCSDVTANGTTATLIRTIYGDWSKPVELVLTENPALVKSITLTDNVGVALQPNDPEGKFANYTVTLSPDGGKTWKELGQLHNSGKDFNAGYMSAQLLEDGQIEVHYNKLKVTASANADSVVNPEYCVLDCDITISRSGLKGQNISFEEMNGRTNVTITNLHDDLKGGMFYHTDNPLSGWSGNGVNVQNGTTNTSCRMEDDNYYRLTLYGRIVADGMKLSAIYYDTGWLEIAK